MDVNNITEGTTVHSTLKFIPVPGPPPPPRSDSLSVKSSAQNSLFSSSMVHKPQQHGTLDASQEESVASAVSKSLPGSPCTPADQAYSSNVEEGSSPIQPDITDTNHNHSEEVISPHEEDSVSTEDTVMSIAGDTGMIQRPVQLIKQDSLYISPRKLSIASHPYPEDVSKRKTHGEILRAGGIVHSVDLSGSRSNLLEAIRKGIQLRKVFYAHNCNYNMFLVVSHLCTMVHLITATVKAHSNSTNTSIVVIFLYMTVAKLTKCIQSLVQ